MAEVESVQIGAQLYAEYSSVPQTAESDTAEYPNLQCISKFREPRVILIIFFFNFHGIRDLYKARLSLWEL